MQNAKSSPAVNKGELFTQRDVRPAISGEAKNLHI